MAGQNPRVERLTPLDVIIPMAYTKTLLTFRTTQPISPVMQSLQKGLDELMGQVPWLSGRLVPSTTKKSETAVPVPEIHWGAEDEATPVLLDKGTVKESYDTLSAMGMPPMDLPADVWPPVEGGFNEAIPAQGLPVFAASIFRFADGQGIGLCICMHHLAVDGTGMAEIMKLWARNSMGTGSGLPSPLSDGGRPDRLDRLYQTLAPHLAVTSSCSTEDLFASHPELSRTPPALPGKDYPPCMSKLFAISVAQLNALKKQLLRSRYNAKSSASPPPSTNTLVCALLWSAITRARVQRDGDLIRKASRLLIAVSIRQRVDDASFSPPGDPYLGNAVISPIVELPAKCLQSTSSGSALDLSHEEAGSLGEICDAITQAPARINPRFIAEVCSLVDGVEDYRTVVPGLTLFSSCDLGISSWANFDWYNMEFGGGLGKPEAVRLPHMGMDAGAIILPRKRAGACNVADGHEVIEVIVMLRSDDMETLERDVLWQAFLA